jgi:ssDNA-binding Zn-finger/Zn-ribbon topoisomerase 1
MLREDKYASGLFPNCNKVILEDCEIRIPDAGELDVVCPNCNYSFGTGMILERGKENSKSIYLPCMRARLSFGLA